jgi:DNA-binding NarL/FixJ family response regulator
MNNLVLISRCQYLLLGLKYLYEKKTEDDGECLEYYSLKGCNEYNLKNSVVIVDIRDDYFESFRLLQVFRYRNPEAKIIVILSCHSSIYFKLTANGLANGIATIQDPIDELVDLILSVSQSESMITKTILQERDSTTSNRVDKVSITPCEITVFDSVMKGVSLTELACIEGRSIKTLSHHKRNLMRKFGIITNMELYRLAKDQLRI